MVRATRRPRAVAAANPTTARIQTALELPLNIEGLQDLQRPFKKMTIKQETFIF